MPKAEYMSPADDPAGQQAATPGMVAPPPLVPPGVPQAGSPADVMPNFVATPPPAQTDLDTVTPSIPRMSQGVVHDAHAGPAPLLAPMARFGANYFRVMHTNVGGVLSEGMLIAREDFPAGIDFERLVELGAIRPATYEEMMAVNRLAQKQHVAALHAKAEGRTSAEFAADLHAQSTTGNPLHPNIPGQ